MTETNYERYFGSPEKTVATLTKIDHCYSSMRVAMTCGMCTDKHELCTRVYPEVCQAKREAWLREEVGQAPWNFEREDKKDD